MPRRRILSGTSHNATARPLSILNSSGCVFDNPGNFLRPLFDEDGDGMEEEDDEGTSKGVDDEGTDEGVEGDMNRNAN